MTSQPAITVLLITVRGSAGYVKHPEWDTIGKVLEDLSRQTYRNFELIVVDGLYDHCVQFVGCELTIGGHSDRRFGRVPFNGGPDAFQVQQIKPLSNLWTRNKKTAICTYRNTGLVHARGELIVNLDDVCSIPPNYLEVFARAYFDYGICLSATWPAQCPKCSGGAGDTRVPPHVTSLPAGQFYVHGDPARPAGVFGFGSYPLEMAIRLNGYDLAYDGSMYLEDSDWSYRLGRSGLKMHFVYLPGFLLHDQSGHDPRAVDKDAPLVTCCNPAWQAQRVKREVLEANRRELWDGAEGQRLLKSLIGPCIYLRGVDHKCEHHNFVNTCEYVRGRKTGTEVVNGRRLGVYEDGFALVGHPLADESLKEENWPVFDLAAERRKIHD